MSDVSQSEAPPSVGDLARQLLDWFSTQVKESRVVVALSGGVDSAVVAKATKEAGNACLAFTSESAAVSTRDVEDARALAAYIGIAHRCQDTRELQQADYVQNDSQRCYHCKSNLYESIQRSMDEEAGNYLIVSGTNADDLGDYRPGLKAAAENRVRAPLAELGIGKDAVRELARYWQLPVSEKAASPCLASRIAYGLEVTETRLKRIESAERWLTQLGFSDVRVRLHPGELARIEVPLSELDRFMDPDHRQRISERLQELGFQFVTFDLRGLQTGSLNRLIQIEV